MNGAHSTHICRKVKYGLDMTHRLDTEVSVTKIADQHIGYVLVQWEG